jgi:hypothetical protein
MVYWSCSSILQLHHSNSGIISPDWHACSLLITAPDVSAMINYRTWTLGVRVGMGRRRRNPLPLRYDFLPNQWSKQEAYKAFRNRTWTKCRSTDMRAFNWRRTTCARHIACTGDKRGAYRVLKRRPERAHLEDGRRWEDTIKTELQKMGWESMACIDRAQDRDRWRLLVNAVTNLRVRDFRLPMRSSWKPRFPGLLRSQ